MAGTNILVRQKDLIAGSGISITPDTTSGNVTIAATNTAIDEARLLPTGGRNGNLLEYQEGVDRGNGADVRLLLQNTLTDSANGNTAPAAVTTQGVTLTGDKNLLFDGNDSHVTAVLATDEIFAADKEWTIDFWMKPTANSSEWNYILTENTGDWGSHSIGLTWNSDDSTLEQDTGGYLASVIRSSNWPNDAVACAADQWHFVAVEKQKTSTGWSLNYYLNGAIWLQVAFTGEFVPFDSSNPFWFGGKTTDSGRWFKGEANKLRVTTGARYGGKAFAAPDRLTDYAAPAGQPVWTEGIDRSRLLPENPANGDIPCFDATATIGGGNDETVKFLLQPATTDGELIDSAAGAVTPATITNHSLTVSESGEIEFSSSKYATVPASGILADVLRHDKPWVFDLLVYLDQTSSQSRFFGTESGGDFFCQWTGDYGFDFKYGDTWISTLTGNVGEWNLLTLEYYQKNGTWHVALYLQGVLCQDKEISTSFDPKTSELAIGRSTSGSHLCSGKIRAIRIREGALYNGQSFTPDEFPYQEPQTVGEWGKLNKSELVKSVNGQTPDSSGAVTLPEATTSAAGLMSATDREKSIGLTTRGFYPNALAKSGAVDFNEVIDHGFYFIGGDTPHLNYPETYQQNGGTLQVIRNGNYLTQTFIPLNINTVFIRTCVNALSDSSVRTFSAWRRALTAPDITESKARPGYFKLPGGTIVQWGKKTAITRDEENCYISFPIAFPTMFLSATAIASSGTLSATGVIVSLSEASTTSMTMVVKNHPNTGSPDMDQYIEMYWFAVGF